MRTKELNDWAKKLNWLAIGRHAAKIFDETVLAIFDEKERRTKEDDEAAPTPLSSNIATRALLEFFESNSDTNPLRDVENAAAMALVRLAEDHARAVPVIGAGIIANAAMVALDTPPAESPVTPNDLTPNDLTPEETVALIREIYDSMPPSRYTMSLQWRGVPAGVLAYIINEIVRRRTLAQVSADKVFTDARPDPRPPEDDAEREACVRESTKDYCYQGSPGHAYECTRENGHAGDCISTAGFEEVLVTARWKQND